MEKKNRTWLWILLAVVGLLLSCALGAIAGGVSGYVVAKRVAQQRIVVPTAPSRLMPVPVPTPRLAARRAALVVRIVPDSPAEDAGLRLGDMIYAVNDEVLTDERDLAALISQYAPGDEVTLRVVRNGRRIEVPVTLGKNPDKPSAPWLGIEYRMVGAAIGSEQD